MSHVIDDNDDPATWWGHSKDRWGKRLLVGSDQEWWWAREDLENLDEPVVFSRAPGVRSICCGGCEEVGPIESDDYLCFNCRNI